MINTETTQVTYLTRADQTTRYSIPFVYNKNELTDAPELTVTLDGSELTFGTDYTVNESGLQLVSAVEEGLELVITRTSVFEQLRDFQTGLIDPEQIEGGFDDSVMRDQELKRDVQKVAESLETETGERMTADTILQGAIDDEANARILADGALQSDIDAEVLTRAGADTTLQTNIGNEALARANADSALQTAVDAKQDIIADLATIRSGAAAGATAVQPAELSAVTGAIDNRVTRIENVVPQNASSSNKLATRADIPAAPAIDGVVLTPTTTKADLGLSNLYTFKGSVSTYANLPATGNVVGDVYNVEDTGNNYAWTENGWDSLGGEFTAPVSSVNGMTGAVVLSATDVGALPTTGGTMTGTILLNSGAKIEPTYSSAVLGSRQHPFDTVYTQTVSGGVGFGTFYIPYSDSATVGVFIGYVMTMPTPSLANNTMVFQYLGDTDSNYTHGHFYQCKAQGTSPQTYAWEEIEVQEPGTSYTAGSGIDITNDVISTTSDVLKNLASVSTSLNIGTTTSTDRGGATSVGINAVAGNWGTAVGNTTNAAPYALALGQGASAEANGAIQLSCGGGMHYNSVANTFKVANSTGNYELMSADGTIPEARLADTTNAAQGQVLTLDSNLNAVWQASSGAVSSVNGQTGTVVLGASDVGALPTSGGTMTGTITLGSGANIVGNNRLINIGSSQYPIRQVYVDTLSAGDQYGRFMIPAADQSTFGFFIALVDPMPTARQDLEAMIFQYMGVTDSNYTHGYFYECVTDDNTTWYWKQLDVQPSSGGATYTAGSGISIDANNEISVADPVLVNKATQSTSVDVVGSGSTYNKNYSTVLGRLAYVTGDETAAIGYNARAGMNGVSVGAYANTGNNGVALGGHAGNSSATGNVCIGYRASTGNYSNGRLAISIGYQTTAGASNSIQIGSTGIDTYTSNSDANTFKVANANGNFEIMSADGTVPTARLTKVNTTATLAVADWSSNTQTVTVSGVKADSVVFVSPAPASASDYASAGILCTAQAADSLTFSCTQTPSSAIVVNIVCM